MDFDSPIENTQLTISPALLSEEALHHLAREFLLREQGQENWSNDLDLEISRVVASIQRGEFLITYDALTESVGIKDQRRV